MNREKVIKYLEETQQIIIYVLLSIWFIIPLLKEIIATSLFTIKYEYVFMELAGIIGIYFLIYTIYKNLIYCNNKKEYIKEIAPIMLFGLYMIWTLISCIYAPNRNIAFSGNQFRREGYITYLTYSGFFSIGFLSKSKKIKKQILNIFLISAITTLIFIEMANHRILFRIFWIKNVRVGVFNNLNHYGYYLLLANIVSYMLLITEKNKVMKVIYSMTYIFLLYYLVKNNTFGCYLAISITLLFTLICCIYKKKKILEAIFAIIIFFIITSVTLQNGKNIAVQNFKTLFNDIKKIETTIAKGIKKESNESEKNESEKAGSGRIRLWKNGLIFFMQRPIIGYGADNLTQKYEEVGIIQDRPHNLIIQLATTSGLPGLLLYTSAIRNYFKKSIRKN